MVSSRQLVSRTGKEKTLFARRRSEGFFGTRRLGIPGIECRIPESEIGAARASACRKGVAPTPDLFDAQVRSQHIRNAFPARNCHELPKQSIQCKRHSLASEHRGVRSYSFETSTTVAMAVTQAVCCAMHETRSQNYNEEEDQGPPAGRNTCRASPRI